MKKNIWQFFCLILVICFSVIACSQTSNDSKQNSISEANTEQATVTKAERVVALTSLTADITYQLDSTKLVGIAGSRLLKQDKRFTNLPTVSEGRTQANLEKIVALKPDLVIGAKGFSDRVLTKVEELGIKTITTSLNSWEDLEQVTKTVADAIAANPQPLLASYQSYIPDNFKSDASTLVLVSRQPILAPNKKSWAGDLLAKFQAKNLAADLQGSSPFGGYVTLSAEKVLQANPEIILLVDPGQQGIEEQLKVESFWKELQATQSNRVYVFDYYGLVNPGSLAKIKEACQKLEQIFSS
ncbi:ABC transporter substrate-binding protein [Calothrix rhizosoleniae]|uniref:ABC transporter substrate-binding protein n=1 Tax=Calothrix rhizosoleniae TaxID=888997 RepID=UPI000B4A06B6|nr:ABC transporter substrate-binding protein [Calothrix rhizosoleniae]